MAIEEREVRGSRVLDTGTGRMVCKQFAGLCQRRPVKRYEASSNMQLPGMQKGASKTLMGELYWQTVGLLAAQY